ncbi:CoA transferase [Carboxydothermus islandicus]|uniref:CoA transferase n=1 Tax=Carboxydothermus islandicus TaxID=661089 RepID=A0A1L8D3L6_9THEO|nr:CoA transferase [Carboxydothermus islandicus]GAV25694.1 CoA transferase [Carboxydothermus islandicus]
MVQKPLHGLKVLDLTRVLAGPYATMILADMGANVIKVEMPGRGDDSRAFGPFLPDGTSAYFASLNRGKKSITLNLKKEKAREIFLELVKTSDVLVENFRPGTMEKLGLGYEKLKEVNPRLIYAASSGFGQTGPYREKPAYDMIVQGMGGIMSITGEPGRPPVRVGVSIGDITAGLFTVIGILTALYQREETGVGQMVDVSMLDCQIAILENAIARYAVNREVPGPLGTRHPSITPFQAYPTQDGYVIVACGNDTLWEKFCRAIKKEELLADERFATNPLRTKNVEILEEILKPVFQEKTTAEWLVILENAGVPAGPINTVDKLFDHPQVLARDMLKEVITPAGDRLVAANNPIKLSYADTNLNPVVPALGEHTREVLESLGFGDKYDDLVAEGVI